MGSVIELDMCPVNAVADDLPREGVTGCFATTVDRHGIYSYGDCGMSPEQMLAAAENMKRYAMSLIDGRSD